jgi:predicted ATPase
VASSTPGQAAGRGHHRGAWYRQDRPGGHVCRPRGGDGGRLDWSWQILGHYGAGEAYLPILEALGRLGRGSGGERLVALLRQYAPSWLVQMPGLLPPAAWEMLQYTAGGATQPRMLRELTEALDVLTTERPLVLVLEDLHWSDASTLDWLAYVARRREPGRLLVLGTYRPVEAVVHVHPVRTVVYELQLHGWWRELPLDYLTEVGVAAYLRQRVGAGTLSAGLVRVLHQRTTGNPLFLVTIVETLARQGVLREGATGWELASEQEAITMAVPESLQRLFERQLEQLAPEEQELLAAASVAGKEFAVAAVAAGVNGTLDDVESRCAALAQRGQFVQPCGTDTWPDGTVATRYGFLHDLYRETLYAHVPAGRRVRWHRQIGLRLEAGYGPQAREVAVEVAEHFVRGRDAARAVPYLHYAGEQAVQRRAPQEAIAHFTRALELLQRLPDTPEHTAQELQVRMALGPALMATRGYADPEVAHTYARARELCQQMGETPELFPALWGLWQYINGSAQFQAAWELSEHLLAMAQQRRDPVLLLQAHHALWSTALNLGAFTVAYEQTEHGRRLYTPALHRVHAVRYGVDDPGVCAQVVAAHVLWLLGYPDQAVQRAAAALALARELAHPFSLAWAWMAAATVYQFRREVQHVHEQAKAALALGTAHGFPYIEAVGTILQGWALAMQGRGEEGIAQIRQGLASWQAMGTAHMQQYFLAALGEAYGKAGQADMGLAALAEALGIVDTTGERKEEAELYRLKGALLLQAGIRRAEDEAEASFHHALALARQQQAKSWELRAATSLSRLWQRQGKRAEARALLAPIYGWFTEGFDTADLLEAKALLAELA